MNNQSNNSNNKINKVYSNRINKILDVLNKSNISNEKYNSNDKPFFNNDSNKTTFKIEFNNKNIDKLPSSLNRNIINIYNILGNPDKEIYLNDWTIMSLNKVLEIYKSYCDKGQSNVFDIGYTYLGMGYIKVISCDLNTHLLFYRTDGGSNGYDREYNFNELIKNGSSNFEQFFFSSWFFNIFKD